MNSEKPKSQARLRLLKSDDFNLCSSYSRTAGVPLGSPVRPCSISLTADADSPECSPISRKVIPECSRSSEIIEDHGMGASATIVSLDMRRSLRQAVETSQRLPVTAFRDNSGMPFPPEIPRNLATIGKRVRAWREYRDITRATLAKRVGYKSVSGLSDLELDRSGASEKLHLIAMELHLNARYLETGDGEPESGAAPIEQPSRSDDWPIPGIPKSRLKKLNKIERGYFETEALKILSDIESERRNKTG